MAELLHDSRENWVSHLLLPCSHHGHVVADTLSCSWSFVEHRSRTLEEALATVSLLILPYINGL